jgi:hypothetical protein
MASSSSNQTTTRKRILANAQGRKKDDAPEGPTEEELAAAAEQEANAERILSKRVKAGAPTKRRKAATGKSSTQVWLLGAIVVVGIGAIIGLRYIAELFGVNWIGD